MSKNENETFITKYYYFLLRLHRLPLKNLNSINKYFNHTRLFYRRFSCCNGEISGMGCTLGQWLAATATLTLGYFIDLISLVFAAYVGILKLIGLIIIKWQVKFNNSLTQVI